MGKLLEQFLAYYNSASAQQKKADWEEFSIYNESGPQVLSLTETSMYYFKIEEKESFGVGSAVYNNEMTYNLAA